MLRSPSWLEGGGHKHTNAHGCVQHVLASAPWAVDQVCAPHQGASPSPPAGTSHHFMCEEIGQVQPECGEVPAQHCLEVQGLDVRSPSL